MNAMEDRGRYRKTGFRLGFSTRSVGVMQKTVGIQPPASRHVISKSLTRQDWSNSSKMTLSSWEVSQERTV
jgi:hypothetical protein